MASISQSLFVFFLLISYLLLLISAEPEETYSSHDCPPFPCGDQDMMIGFPFANITHPNCGVVIVDCSKKPVTIQLAMTDERRYQLTSLNRGLDHQPNAYVLGIRDQNLSENLSSGICKSITNSTIPPFYDFNPPIPSLTLLKCIHTVDIGLKEFEPDGFQCKDNYKFYYQHPVGRIPFGCSIIHLPSKPGSDPSHRIVTAEFELVMHVPPECSQCHEGEVQCDLDPENKFICAKEKEGKKREVLAIALGTLFVAIGVLIVSGLSFRKKFRSINVINLLKKESLTHQSVETFLKNNGPFGIRRYSYSNIKKMTNFLRDKLGQGGYGSVYKGKLQDGSLVAVKVLKGSIGNGEEFINEVASISRTSHVNIVTLKGFCFEGSKRALVYEFMPNGSLEKFIYKKDLLSNHQLQWETLYKIAVGIARGLEYLHRGCNTRILHFDIKPHNILLDENFCPKISDFGLAKVCPREQSIISMLGVRGTAGYIAPEVFCRNIGGVSHKSDVYSYGMMVLEILGGRKNIDIEVDHTSEIYFPHWIYRRLELNEELKLHGLMTEEDRKNAKKMTIVSLWCIQTDPSNRPTMSRVVEMLEMSLNSLRIPPKPFLSSPSRLGVDSSTIVALSPSGSIVP